MFRSQSFNFVSLWKMRALSTSQEHQKWNYEREKTRQRQCRLRMHVFLRCATVTGTECWHPNRTDESKQFELHHWAVTVDAKKIDDRHRNGIIIFITVKCCLFSPCIETSVCDGSDSTCIRTHTHTHIYARSFARTSETERSDECMSASARGAMNENANTFNLCIEFSHALHCHHLFRIESVAQSTGKRRWRRQRQLKEQKFHFVVHFQFEIFVFLSIEYSLSVIRHFFLLLFRGNKIIMRQEVDLLYLRRENQRSKEKGRK